MGWNLELKKLQNNPFSTQKKILINQVFFLLTWSNKPLPADLIRAEGDSPVDRRPALNHGAHASRSVPQNRHRLGLNEFQIAQLS